MTALQRLASDLQVKNIKGCKGKRRAMKKIAVAALLLVVLMGGWVWASDLDHAGTLAVAMAERRDPPAIPADAGEAAASLFRGGIRRDDFGPPRGFNQRDQGWVRSVSVPDQQKAVADGAQNLKVQITLADGKAGNLVLSAMGGSISPNTLAVSAQSGRTIEATFRSGTIPGNATVVASLCQGWNCSAKQVTFRLAPSPQAVAQAVELRKQAEAKRTEAKALDSGIADLESKAGPKLTEAEAARQQAEAKRNQAKLLRADADKLEAGAKPYDPSGTLGSVSAGLRGTASGLNGIRNGVANQFGQGQVGTIDQALGQYGVDLPGTINTLNNTANAVAAAGSKGADAVQAEADKLRQNLLDPMIRSRDKVVADSQQYRNQVRDWQAKIDQKQRERQWWAGEHDKHLNAARSHADRYNRSCHNVWGANICTDMGAWWDYTREMAGVEQAKVAMGLADTEAGIYQLNQIVPRIYVSLADSVIGQQNQAIAQVQAQVKTLTDVAANLRASAKDVAEKQKQARTLRDQAAQVQRDAATLDKQAADAARDPQVQQLEKLNQQRQSLLDEAARLDQAADRLAPR